MLGIHLTLICLSMVTKFHCVIYIWVLLLLYLVSETQTALENKYSTSEALVKINVADRKGWYIYIQYIATCLLIRSCVCRSVLSLHLTMLHVPSELPWSLFIPSSVCLFIFFASTVLCSWANKVPFCPVHCYGPIKGCDQPEQFNDGCGAAVDQLTERQKGKKSWHAVRWCLQHTSVVAQWLHCRQQTG